MVTDKQYYDSKFIGSYNLKLLAGSKIKIPDSFLNVYKHRQYNIIRIFPWIDNSLALFSIKEFERKKKLKRFINKSGISKIENGKIFINNSLLSYAKIQRNIVMIGVLNYIEIWAKEVWDNYLKKQNKTIKETMDEIDLLK